LCALNEIEMVGQVDGAEPTTTNCQLIAEPDGVNRFEEADAEVAVMVKVNTPKSKGLFSFSKRS